MTDPMTGVSPAGYFGIQFGIDANGRLLTQAQTAEWTRVEVGLTVGSYAQGGVEIAFDNFSVTQP